MYISLFSFDLGRKLSLSSVIKEKWIATTANSKKTKASKQGNSAQIYIHSILGIRKFIKIFPN